MAISPTLSSYLNQHSATYDLIPHPHTSSSMETAEKAHVSGDRLAKAVIVRDEDRYIMIVVPSSEHIDLAELRHRFGHLVDIASEGELSRLFPDCTLGAVPPTGTAWGLETYVDERLIGPAEIYFEAGDHEELVRVSGDEFEHLMEDASRGHFGHTTQRSSQLGTPDL